MTERVETGSGGPASASPSPVEELVEAMGTLWPGADVSLASARTRDRGSVAEWAVVPGPRSPQQLVPLASARAASRALRRFSAAASVRATTSRLAAAAAVRSTRGSAFSHRVRVHGPTAGSLDDHLAELLGRPVCWSLGIGPARVNRKPVLQIFDERGRTLAFGKLGDDDSRRDVDAEATALARVGAQSWRTMLVPRLLSRSEWNGMLVVLMSPLETSPVQRPADQWRPPGPAMRELADRYAEAPVPLGELAWLGRQRQLLAGLRDAELASRTLACAERLVELAGDQPCPVSAWHGDWAPWNVARAGRARWQVWDWERFETGVPAALDRHHWHVNAATRARGETPAAIRSGLKLARATNRAGGPDPVGTEPSPDVAACTYLLATAARYLAHSERTRAGEIERRTRLVVEVLEERLAGGLSGP